MLRYFLKRVFLALPAIWLVLTLVFLMIQIVPGDPVEQMLGEGAAPRQVTQLRHALGLDLPLHTQYGHYLWQLGHADLGQSFKFQLLVRQIILEFHPSRRSNSCSLRGLSAPRLPFPREWLPLTVAARRPTALSKG